MKMDLNLTPSVVFVVMIALEIILSEDLERVRLVLFIFFQLFPNSPRERRRLLSQTPLS